MTDTPSAAVAAALAALQASETALALGEQLVAAHPAATPLLLDLLGALAAAPGEPAAKKVPPPPPAFAAPPAESLLFTLGPVRCTPALVKGEATAVGLVLLTWRRRPGRGR